MMRAVLVALLCASTASAAFGASGADDDSFELARGFHAAGFMEAAARSYADFIESNPKDARIPEARFGLGECRFRQGHYKKASAEFSAIKSRGFARSDELKLRLGQCRHFEGRHDEAAKLLQGALGGKLPKDLAEGARYFLARSLVELGRGDEAAKILGSGSTGAAGKVALLESLADGGEYDRALKVARGLLGGALAPELAAEVRFREAEALRALGRSKEAASSYSKLLGAGPTAELAAAARLGLGWTHLGGGRAAEAMKLARAVRAKPPAPELSDEARFLEAVALGATGAHGEAAALLGRLAVDSPKRFGLRAERARMWELHLAGRAEETRRAAHAFLKREGTSAGALHQARYLAAESELSLGATAKALELFRAVADGEGDEGIRTAARFGEAATLSAMGKHDEAAKKFDGFAGANRQHPLAAAALVGAGREYLAMKLYAESEGIFFQAIAATKDESLKAAALWGLALAAAGEGDKPQLAARRFEEFLKKHPKDERASEAMLWLGWHRFSSGEVAASIATYDALLKERPGTAAAGEARYRLALACHAAGRTDRAAALFDELRKSSPARLGGEVHLWLADQGRARGDLKTAAEVLESFAGFTRDPDLRSRALYFLGEVKLEAGDSKGAAVVIDRLMREFPKSPYLDAARLMKGTALRLAGDLDGAEVLLENVISSVEGVARAKAHYELGMLKLARERREDTAGALREFLRVVVLYKPADEGEGAAVWAGSALKAARASLVLEDPEGARRLLKSILAEEKCRRTPAAGEAKKLLGAIR